MDLWENIRIFGIGIVSLFIGASILFLGYNLWALALGAVSIEYFVGGVALIVLFGGWWLTQNDQGGIGKVFMISAGLVFITISLSFRFPGLLHFGKASAKEADIAAERAAVDISRPREIPCNKTTPNLEFYNHETGKPKIWLAEEANGYLHCYDRKGHLPQDGRVLVSVDEDLRKRVLSQEPPAPASAPIVIVEPQQNAAPILVLGDGLVKDLPPDSQDGLLKELDVNTSNRS